MNPQHSPENLWKMSIEQLKAMLLTVDGVGSEVKGRALEIIINREVDSGYPERNPTSDALCFVCNEPTNSLHGNPNLWAMHFPHVDAPSKHRCYHIGCLYPILKAAVGVVGKT
jgi:hypothetical protein